MAFQETELHAHARNTAIAAASENQHHVNVERRVNDFNLHTRIRSGIAIAALEDVAEHLGDIAEKKQALNELAVPVVTETMSFLSTIPEDKAKELKEKLQLVLDALQR